VHEGREEKAREGGAPTLAHDERIKPVLRPRVSHQRLVCRGTSRIVRHSCGRVVGHRAVWGLQLPGGLNLVWGGATSKGGLFELPGYDSCRHMCRRRTMRLTEQRPRRRSPQNTLRRLPAAP